VARLDEIKGLEGRMYYGAYGMKRIVEFRGFSDEIYQAVGENRGYETDDYILPCGHSEDAGCDCVENWDYTINGMYGGKRW
jgi:hypothetical protein